MFKGLEKKGVFFLWKGSRALLKDLARSKVKDLANCYVICYCHVAQEPRRDVCLAALVLVEWSCRLVRLLCAHSLLFLVVLWFLKNIKMARISKKHENSHKEHPKLNKASQKHKDPQDSNTPTARRVGGAPRSPHGIVFASRSLIRQAKIPKLRALHRNGVFCLNFGSNHACSAI